MCPANLSFRWCLTWTHLRVVCSVTCHLPMDLWDPNRRRLIIGSSCRDDSVTPYQCPPSCPALRPSVPLLMLAPVTTVLLMVTQVSSLQHCQVSRQSVTLAVLLCLMWENTKELCYLQRAWNSIGKKTNKLEFTWFRLCVFAAYANMWFLTVCTSRKLFQELNHIYSNSYH